MPRSRTARQAISDLDAMGAPAELVAPGRGAGGRGGARGAGRRGRAGAGEGAGGALRHLHRVHRGGSRGACRGGSAEHPGAAPAPAPPPLEGAAPAGCGAETVVEAQVPTETVRGEVPTETVHGKAPPAGAPGPASRRGRAMFAGGIGALAVVAALAWFVVGLGGGEEAGGGSTTALRLSTETISLSREVGGDAERLAESVEGNGPTGDLTGDFEASRREASTLARRARSELAEGDPGRADLERAGGDFGDSTAALARVAAAPGAGGAKPEARGAKQAMSTGLTALNRALAEQQRAFAGEGATEAASSVSLAQLRESRTQLIAPFDALLGAL